MAVSDQLFSLANRAKGAEDRVAAAHGKAKAQLEGDVQKARDSAQAQAGALRGKAEKSEAKLSSRWNDVQRRWNDNVASARERIDEKKAELDVKHAQKAADNAEGDAAFAIDFAYAAVEEAEYEALDAILARVRAEELVGASG